MTNKRIIAIGILTAVFSSTSYFWFDIPLARFFYSSQSWWTEVFFEIVTRLGESQWYLVSTAVIFIYCRRKYEMIAFKSLYIFSSIAASGIIVTILKTVLGRFRPSMLFKQELYGFDFFQTGYNYLSFPSGHSATALSLMVALAILLPKLRYLLLFLGLLIAFSRVAIVSHYLSDVCMGAYIGGSIALGVYDAGFRKKVVYHAP